MDFGFPAFDEPPADETPRAFSGSATWQAASLSLNGVNVRNNWIAFDNIYLDQATVTRNANLVMDEAGVIWLPNATNAYNFKFQCSFTSFIIPNHPDAVITVTLNAIDEDGTVRVINSGSVSEMNNELYLSQVWKGSDQLFISFSNNSELGVVDINSQGSIPLILSFSELTDKLLFYDFPKGKIPALTNDHTITVDCEIETDENGQFEIQLGQDGTSVAPFILKQVRYLLPTLESDRATNINFPVISQAIVKGNLQYADDNTPVASRPLNLRIIGK